MFSGISIVLLQFSIFYACIRFISKIIKTYSMLDFVSYMWITLTILTGIWEISFIAFYSQINNISAFFIKNRKHVWFCSYDISYILPWKFARIFYAEYGAYADREYMTRVDTWSRIIEGTHAILCGIISFVSLYYLSMSKREKREKFINYINIAMGAQLMNSILYMGNYIIEINNINSVNYNSEEFPCGTLMSKRPFMYVNILWTIMPCYVIYKLLLIPHRIQYHKQDDITPLNI
jgi:hypothetical protein